MTAPDITRTLSPTPFHRLDRLSEYLGVDVYCKRDDLTGFGFGGNKTRKLDYLLSEAQRRGATDLVATGAVQSNFCRMAAAYASASGLDCHLVLGGKEPSTYTGNLLLDALFGAELHFVESERWDDWERKAAEIENELLNRGRRPYRMPIGGSTPTGALGYVAAFEELLNDARIANVEISEIIHASSSGGTQAGLVVGQVQRGWNGKVTGISVAWPAGVMHGVVKKLARETAAAIGIQIDDPPVLVDDRWIGDGYAIPTTAGSAARNLFARLEGIILDDVYTAKAAAAMIGRCQAGDLERKGVVVFLHTGGSPGVFAGRSE